jgi:hypothetical protein
MVTPTRVLTIALNRYAAVPIPPGEDGTAAWRLRKESGEVYDVIRDRDGLVCCDCPSYEVTFRNTEKMCKHGRALVAAGMLDAPDPVPRAVR